MSLDIIKKRFFDITGNSSNIADKRDCLLSLQRIVNISINEMKPRISNDTPTILKWNYDDLLMFDLYIKQELLDLKEAVS